MTALRAAQPPPCDDEYEYAYIELVLPPFERLWCTKSNLYGTPLCSGRWRMTLAARAQGEIMVPA